MKAYVKKGKLKGKLVTIHQYCNDWFMVEEQHNPMTPTQLMFTQNDMLEMAKNNESAGQMFFWYEPFFDMKNTILVEENVYAYSFRKRSKKLENLVKNS